MVDVDGVKYVSEKEFEKAVLKELDVIASIATSHFLETGNFRVGLNAGLVIAEAYSNLKVELFGKGGDSDASTGD